MVAEEDVPNPWRALATMVGKNLDGNFTAVAYVDNPGTDTQAWLYRNVAHKEAIISFRCARRTDGCGGASVGACVCQRISVSACHPMGPRALL